MLHLKFLTLFLQFFSCFLIFFMLLLQFLILSLAVLYVFLLMLSFPSYCCLFLVLCHGCPVTLDVSSAVCVVYTGCHYAFSPVFCHFSSCISMFVQCALLDNPCKQFLGFFAHRCLDFTLHFYAYFLQFFKLALQFFVFSFNVKCVSYYLMVTNRNREHYLLKKCLSSKI